MERINGMVSEKPLVIFCKSSCCMSHIIKRLFYELGAKPMVYELDEIPNGREIEQALQRMGAKGNPTVPMVFIGGEVVGGASEIMSLHVNGALIPRLRRAGAL